MADKVFIDSNILIYAYSVDEPKKQKIAHDLFNKHDEIIISTQTINEFINVTARKKCFQSKKYLWLLTNYLRFFQLR